MLSSFDSLLRIVPSVATSLPSPPPFRCHLLLPRRSIHHRIDFSLLPPHLLPSFPSHTTLPLTFVLPVALLSLAGRPTFPCRSPYFPLPVALLSLAGRPTFPCRSPYFPLPVALLSLPLPSASPTRPLPSPSLLIPSPSLASLPRRPRFSSHRLAHPPSFPCQSPLPAALAPPRCFPRSPLLFPSLPPCCFPRSPLLFPSIPPAVSLAPPCCFPRFSIRRLLVALAAPPMIAFPVALSLTVAFASASCPNASLAPTPALLPPNYRLRREGGTEGEAGGGKAEGWEDKGREGEERVFGGKEKWRQGGRGM
ncbi:unnamed protein product [Closterium sp. NIES-64]|nr:unnamed protein product [Closterium sp. NIES-64]